MRATRQIGILACTVVACLLLLIGFTGKTSFSASVVDLLAGDSKETRILQELATGSSGKLLLLRLYTSTGQVGAASKTSFRDSLQDSGSVDKIWSTGQDSLEDAGKQLFADRYFWLLPNWIEGNFDASASGAAIDANTMAQKIVGNLSAYLDSPDGMALVDLITRDPFLLMGQLEDLFSTISVDENASQILLWIEQAGSPFDEAAQENLFRSLDSALQQARMHQPDLQMEYSGVAVFASASKQAIKAEIERLNILGIALVLLIAVFVVRNIASLVRIGIVVMTALLIAATAVVTIFDTVHVIALVIGSILTGIAVDYGFHMLLREKGCLTNKETRKVVIAGSLSSALGFLVLIGAPLPFLRQVGVFVGFGLLAAMAAALLSGSESKDQAPLRTFQLRPGQLPMWVAVLFLIIAIPGLSRLTWKSDIQDLEYPLPKLKETDSRLRSAASPLQSMHPYLLYGEDIIDCRERLGSLDPEKRLTHAGNLLPPFESVHTTWQRMQQLDGFPEALYRELDRAGFYTDPFDAFLADWESYLELPVSPEVYRAKMDVFSHSLPGPLQNFIHIGDDIAWIMVLSPKPLDTELHPHLIHLDQSDMLSREFAQYGRTMWLFAGFCVAVLAISVCTYFGVRAGLEAIAVPLLATAMAFGILGIWHGAFGLFHIVGGLLAFCISLDYGLFAVTARARARPLPKSISVSSITTIAVFGVLASSHVPGVHQMAVTVILIMAFTLLLICCRWPRVSNDKTSLFSRIPHGEEARMVKLIRSLEPDQIEAVCSPHEYQPVPSECLVEAMAQCAALLLAGGEDKKASRSGMLVVVQTCEIHSATIHPGQTVIARVQLLSEAKEGLVQFSGTCFDENNVALTTARFSVFIPPIDSKG